MKHTFIILFSFYCLFGYSQVGIGTNNPNPSAMLEVSAFDAGVLVPRIALIGLNDTGTISNGNVESLLVYNTADTPDLDPGFYYWTGVVWKRLSTIQDITEKEPWFSVDDNMGATENLDDIYTLGKVAIGQDTLGRLGAGTIEFPLTINSNNNNVSLLLNGSIQPRIDFQTNQSGASGFNITSEGNVDRISIRETGSPASFYMEAGSFRESLTIQDEGTVTIGSQNSLPFNNTKATMVVEGGALSNSMVISQDSNMVLNEHLLLRIPGPSSRGGVLTGGNNNLSIQPYTINPTSTAGITAHDGIATVGNIGSFYLGTPDPLKADFSVTVNGNLDALQFIERGRNSLFEIDAGTAVGALTIRHDTANGDVVRVGDIVGTQPSAPTINLEVTGVIKVGDDSTVVTPEAGMIRFNSTTNTFQGYDGSSWVNL